MIELIFEHPDFYVVNKPAGVGFHDEKDQSTGFFNLCCGHFAQALYPVHRLDKMTSGLLILARNQTAAVWFQQAFSQRTIAKLYLALADCKPKKKQGSIIGDMSKSRNSQWKLSKTKQNPAVTRFFSWGVENKPGLRLFLLKPETGKTHQLRVALKSLGSAIIGDPLYLGAKTKSERGYLHAYALTFVYQGQHIELYQLPTQGELFTDNLEFIKQCTNSGFAKPWPTSDKGDK